MRKRIRPLIHATVLVMIIGAIFLAGKPELSSAQDGGFRIYQLAVYCGNSGVASVIFGHEVTEGGTVGRPLMGTKSICAGNCPGGTVPLADALAGLPANVSAALQAKVDKHQENAAAGKGRPLACLLDDKKPPEEKKPCDNAKLCAALNSAYESVSRALDTLNSGGRPPTSYADFKANLSRQLDKIQEELERCKNPSGKIAEVKQILATPFTNPLDQLESVQRALNSARVDFMQSGGPCYAMPRSTTDSSVADPPTDSPSGGGAPGQEGPCKEGEKPKTAQDNAAISQLIRLLGQDISKLEQLASVLRGSRQLAAVRAKIEKLKKMRIFWQQVMAVQCVPPEIVQMVRSYLQERQANGDTTDECNQLCSATSAWLEQQTNSNLQMNFSMDGCLASCK